MADEYDFLETDSVKQWLCDRSVEEILESWIQCINRRDYETFQIQFSIIEVEWSRVRKDPSAWEFYL